MTAVLPQSTTPLLPSPQRDGAPEPAAIQAPLLTRALAFFVDYLVLLTFAALTPIIGVPPDWEFVFSFAVGTLYFGWCHSAEGQGQTLGKRLFRLQVFATTNSGAVRPLSFGGAVLRYFFTFGLIILISQLPAALYRELGTTSVPWKLEFHMWACLALSCLDVGYWLATPGHRAYHDFLASTVVVKKNDLQGLVFRIDSNHRRSLIAIVAALIVATFLWSQGLPRNPVIQRVSSYRYVVERDFPFRLIGAEAQEDALDLIVASNIPGADKAQESTQSVALVKRLIAAQIIDPNTITKVQFHLISRPTSGSRPEATRFMVKTSDFSITSLPELPI